ncbi:hypothetical protein THICB3310063 [Thiomonas sp. CB3]|nr:hypothetical protein THICB3310063 [Thiomonas sp. CB3]
MLLGQIRFYLRPVQQVGLERKSYHIGSRGNLAHRGMKINPPFVQSLHQLWRQSDIDLRPVHLSVFPISVAKA